MELLHVQHKSSFRLFFRINSLRCKFGEKCNFETLGRTMRYGTGKINVLTRRGNGWFSLCNLDNLNEKQNMILLNSWKSVNCWLNLVIYDNMQNFCNNSWHSMNCIIVFTVNYLCKMQLEIFFKEVRRKERKYLSLASSNTTWNFILAHDKCLKHYLDSKSSCKFRLFLITFSKAPLTFLIRLIFYYFLV